MTLALCGTAFAQSDNGTITVNGKAGYDYTIYRVFNVEYNDTTSAFRYYKNDAWAGFYATTAFTNYFTVSTENGKDYIAVTDGTTFGDAEAKAFAEAALAYAKANNVANDGTKTAGDDNKASFSNLPYGYYLVDSSMGALCHIDTAKPNATVNEKNDIPEIEKEVKEADGSWAEANDVNVGDVIEFRSIVTVQKGAQNYVVTDTFTHMTLESIDGIKVDNTGDYIDASGKYTQTPATVAKTETSFTITFDNDYIKTLAAGTKLYIYYTAKLTSDAVIDTGDPNDVKLTWGDDPAKNHDEDETKTYNWSFNVLKYTKNGADETPLAGAKFKLHKEAADGTVVKFNTVSTNNYQYKADGSVEEITTDSTGAFKLYGLDEGVYYLEETEAPDGYTKLASAIKVEILSDGTGTTLTKTIKQDNAALTGDTVKVENKTGSVLPSTGGIGTTIFYVAGIVLVLGAAAIIIARRKSEQE